MRKHIARFYRSTEGLVITIGLYLALAYGIWIAREELFAGPTALSVPVSLTCLVFGAAGFFLWADALQRVLTAVSNAFSSSIQEATNPTFPRD